MRLANEPRPVDNVRLPLDDRLDQLEVLRRVVFEVRRPGRSRGRPSRVAGTRSGRAAPLPWLTSWKTIGQIGLGSVALLTEDVAGPVLGAVIDQDDLLADRQPRGPGEESRGSCSAHCRPGSRPTGRGRRERGRSPSLLQFAFAEVQGEPVESSRFRNRQERVWITDRSSVHGQLRSVCGGRIELGVHRLAGNLHIRRESQGAGRVARFAAPPPCSGKFTGPSIEIVSGKSPIR